MTKKTQMLYESGERSPDAAYLSALAAAGVDILYVLTGQRGADVPDTLTPRERALLGTYRCLPPSAQDAAQTLFGALAEPAAPPYAVKKRREA